MTVKFGVHIEPQLGYDYKNAELIALEAERLGYDSFWASDHLFWDEQSENRNCMDAWTLLAALASRTAKIRLGTLVTCNSYRHPPLLAKIAATVDLISNGRLFFGFGAGWKEIEYNAYGYAFPPIGVRMDQLEEAIQIIRLLWTEDKPSFEGEHYRIKDAFAAPKPVQKPTPPIMIGGDGEKRTLRAVAKYADYCNLFPRPNLEHKLNVLEKHCEAVGRNFNEIGKSLFVMTYGVLVTESEEEKEAWFAKVSEEFGRPIEEIKERQQDGWPGSWVGDADEIRERFQHFVDMGFDYFQVMFPGLGEDYVEASKTFSQRVMKKL